MCQIIVSISFTCFLPANFPLKWLEIVNLKKCFTKTLNSHLKSYWREKDLFKIGAMTDLFCLYAHSSEPFDFPYYNVRDRKTLFFECISLYCLHFVILKSISLEENKLTFWEKRFTLLKFMSNNTFLTNSPIFL